MAVTTGDEFRIPISAKDQSTKVFQAIQKAAKSMSGNVGKAVVVMNQSMELIGRASRLAGQAFDSTLGRAIALEKGVAEVATLLSGDATKATAALTKQILELQSKFGTSQEDLAKAYYQAISSGAVNASTATELLTVAQKLSVGGVTTLATATDGLTTILNSYGLSANKATDVSDALFLGMKAGKTTIGELSSSLGTAAALAASTGVKFQELVAAVSAITTGGVETAAAVTQVRSAIVGLSKQTGPLTDLLDKMGIKSIQAKVAQDGLVGTLKQIIGQTDGTTEQLTKLFGRIEAVNAILALTSDDIGGKFVGIMDDMGKAAIKTGAVTEEAFAKIAATTDFQLAVAQGKLEARLTEFGQLMKPAFTAVISAFSTVVDTFTMGVKTISIAFDSIDMDAFIAKSKALAVALTAVGTAAALAFSGTILASARGFLVTIQALAIAAGTAAAPFVLIAAKVTLLTTAILAVAAAGDILVRNFDLVVLAIRGFVNDARIFFQEIKIALMTFMQPAIEQMAKAQSVWEDVSSAIEGMFSAISSQAASLFDPLLSNFTSVKSAIKKGIDEILGVWGKLKSSISGGLGSISGFLSKAFNTTEAKANLADLSKQSDVITKKLKEGTDNIDLGFAGEGAKQAANFAKALSGANEKIEKSAEAAAKSSDKLAKAQENAGKSAIAASGATGKATKSTTEAIDKQAESIKKLTALGANLHIERLTNSGQFVEAAKIQSDAAVKAFDVEVKALKALAPLSKERLAILEKTRAALVNKGSTDIGKAGEQEKPVVQVFDESQVRLISSALGDASSGFAAAGSAMLAGATTFIAGANAVADGIQGLINAIPQLLGKIADIFNSLTELPLKIVEGMGKVLASITNVFANLIPNLAKALPKLISQVFVELPRIIQEGVFSLLDALPSVVSELIASIPELITSILSPDMIMKAVNFLIKEMPRIAIALAKALAIELPKAIIKGLVDALKGIGGAISNLFKGIFPSDEIQKGLAKITDTISRSTSQLFKVVDLEAEARGLDVADRISNAIRSSTVAAANILTRAWDALKEVWNWALANVLEPLAGFVSDAFQWVITNVLDPLMGVVSEAFGWVVEHILNPLANLVKTAWIWVKEKILNPLAGIVSTAFSWVVEKILNPLKGIVKTAFNWVKENILDPIWNIVTGAFNWVKINVIDAIAGAVSGAWHWVIVNIIDPIRTLFDPIKDFAWPSFSTPGWVNDFVGAVNKLSNIGNIGLGAFTGGLISDPIGAVSEAVTTASSTVTSGVNRASNYVSKRVPKFATGGLASSMGKIDVPVGKVRSFPTGNVLYAAEGAAVGGNQGTDTISAKLTPGEFVVNREATRNNLGLLSFINNVREPVSAVESSNNFSIVINAKTMLDANQIRREVIPELQKQLRQQSQRGKFVIDSAGIRTG